MDEQEGPEGQGAARESEAGSTLGGGGGSGRVWALLARVDLDAGLRAVPVVGPMVPEEADVRLEALSVVGTSKALGPTDVQKLNQALALVKSGDLLVPKGLTSSLAVGVTASLSGKRQDLWAPQIAAVKSTVVTGGEPPDGIGGATTGAVVWFPVGRGLGPVRLERLGLQYRSGAVWVLADASVELSGLTFAVDGMGLGVPVKDPAHVTARLDGLGLAWNRPPLKVAGSFLLRQQPGYTVLIDGAAAVETPALALVAVGGYAQKQGQGPSVFIFGRLALKNGEGVGPPPFRITGAAAGFGFNSTVRIPGVEEISAFPLMPAGTDDLLANPLGYLDKLTGAAGGKPWISQAPGRAWLAAGVDFDSFKFLKGSALALVDFGTAADKDFTLALLGHLAAEFPNGKEPFAKIGLDLSASYSSRTDMLGVYAKISPGSFVVHPSCQLSGGAALCVWFGASAHPGDFVATVGGYHPHYARPSHYPEVERLQLSWSVSDKVSMRGSCYAALTPSAFMAGTDVSVSFHAGPIGAGCDVGIDALIQWDPFHFEVTAHADVWVEVDLWLATLRGTFGVGVQFWGPPTGGVASVHALGRSFDISFGEDRPKKKQVLTWDQFTTSRLHQPVVEVHPATGLLPAGGAAPDEPWQMSHDAFSLTTRSAVPVTRARLRTGGKDTVPKGWTDKGDLPVRPADLKAIACTHTVEVTRDQKPYDIEKNRWVVEAINGRAPLGLWGEPIGADAEPSLPSGEQTTDAVTGLRLNLPPVVPGQSAALATTEKTLAYEDTDGPRVPLPAGKSPVPAAAASKNSVREKIAAGIAGTGTGATGRAVLTGQLALWDLAPASDTVIAQDALGEFSEHLWLYLRTEPLLGQDTEGTQ
ncbi:DUF6603 domain-containing protein [Streptomyces sp. NPDC002225]|uniref:DUF6603 domain-containing protein n=1 Tax=Streptomyces sp. NPDC002225 TaxID=3154413 RepID=UPI00332C3379